MKTFVLIAVVDEQGKESLRKCRVYNKKMDINEMRQHLFPHEKLINFEYAHMAII